MLKQLTEHLSVFEGPINAGVLRDGDRFLVIDCGDGAVAAKVAGKIDRLLFTHHHRDQVCGAAMLAGGGAEVIVPRAERALFESPERFWNDPAYRYHLYDKFIGHKMAGEAIRVDRTVAKGDRIVFGDAAISVAETPGHTDGSVTYLVDVDGRRIAFTGDLIYAPGQVWDLVSMQKGNEHIGAYHGFMGAREQVIDSLRDVLAAGPDTLVPSHGVVIDDPAAAVDLLENRLRSCYKNYAAISALRWYFPKMFPDQLDGPDVMPIGGGSPAPDYVRHVETTFVLVSESGAAFVMDCGSANVISTLKGWLDTGDIRAIDAMWVTHYHDDHADKVQEFKDEFGVPVIADECVADVLADPLEWRLPCNTANPVPFDRRTADGESWRWREFTLTAYRFPGQALYHGALLVEGRGQRLFFIGDSFTPAGLDDYCAFNRNFLGAGVGFDRCLSMVSALNPVTLFNCHVAVGFSFTEAQIAYMRDNLARREQLFAELLPWDHPNYGLDEFWVCCVPYEQRAAPGERIRIDVQVTNHSAKPQPASVRISLPRMWGGGASSEVSANVPAKSDARLRIEVAVPGGATSGRYVLPVDIRYQGRKFSQIAEAIVEVVREE